VSNNDPVILSRREVVAGTAASAAVLGASCLVGPTALARCADASQAAHGSRPLEIVGNEFYADGRKFRLLGVGVGDPIYVRANRTTDDYRVITTDWSANVVRISLHPGHWRADPDRSLDRLVREVRAARAVGLRVIIDWHAIGFPGHYFEHPDPAWGLPQDAFVSDETMALGFWDVVARTFGDDPGIMFEIWNEPVVDGELWHSTGKHWPLLKSLWMRLIEVVRKHSDAIVLVAGGCWAHDLVNVADDLIDDDRVAYAWHNYPPWDKGDPAGWRQSLGGVAMLKPVVVTEWGFCRDCPSYISGTRKSFGRPFVDELLEPLKLSSTAWCWSEGAAPQMLQSDGVTPTDYGDFVKQYLRSAARSDELKLACSVDG
jgi:hypothetical protein